MVVEIIKTMGAVVICHILVPGSQMKTDVVHRRIIRHLLTTRYRRSMIFLQVLRNPLS
jgi:hypothetical protein